MALTFDIFPNSKKVEVGNQKSPLSTGRHGSHGSVASSHARGFAQLGKSHMTRLCKTMVIILDVPSVPTSLDRLCLPAQRHRPHTAAEGTAATALLRRRRNPWEAVKRDDMNQRDTTRPPGEAHRTRRKGTLIDSLSSRQHLRESSNSGCAATGHSFAHLTQLGTRPVNKAKWCGVMRRS